MAAHPGAGRVAQNEAAIRACVQKTSTILIADRNPHVRSFLQREMGREGYRVRLAEIRVPGRRFVLSRPADFARAPLALPTMSLAVLCLVGALAFSLCHHMVMGSEPFDSYVFLYRFLFGVALSAIYIYRGLGTAVYTHAIYDILVSLRFGL